MFTTAWAAALCEGKSLGQEILWDLDKRFTKSHLICYSHVQTHTASPRRVISVATLESQFQWSDFGMLAVDLYWVGWSSGMMRCWPCLALSFKSQISLPTHMLTTQVLNTLFLSLHTENNEATGSHVAWLARSPSPHSQLGGKHPLITA